MEIILEYIMSHYILFLGGTIIILLAIIGYYADKTNFGQGKVKELNQEKVHKSQGINKFDTLQEAVENIHQNENQEVNMETTGVNDNQIESNLNNQSSNLNNETINEQKNIMPVQSNQNIVVEENIFPVHNEQNVSVQENNFEENFKEFDKTFKELLPEKDIIDDQILDEIENLSFDKTQKIDLTNVSGLDDVELPKIKNLKPETEDIWKF